MEGIRVFVMVTIALVLCSYHGDCAIQSNESKVSLHVLAMLSTSSGIDVPKWERGMEILPGGLLAVDEINNSTELLQGYHLELVPLMIPMCDPIEGITAFVDAILSTEYNIVGVTGLFCTRLADSISPLAGHEGIDLITLSGSTTYLPEDNHWATSRHLYHMLPSSEVYGRALIGLMEELGWSRIGVIYFQGLYYQKTFEAFSSLISRENLSIEIVFSDEVRDSDDVMRVLQNLRTSGAKIVFTLLPPGISAEIMCRAYVEDFVWPNYAWIFAESDLKFETNIFELCNRSLMENVLVLQQLFDSTANKNFDNVTNIYSYVFHDSVVALALAVNASLEEIHSPRLSNYQYSSRENISQSIDNKLQQLSFEGLTGEVSFCQRTSGLEVPIEILQIRDGKYIRIGLFSSRQNETEWTTMILNEIPSDKLEYVYVLYPVVLMAVLSTLIAVCMLVTTLFLLLFFCFRKEPEVKASSCSLSICIFVGCYLVLLSSFLHTIDSGHILPTFDENRALSTFVCTGGTSLSTIGLDLLLATLIAKTLRIYHIFNNTSKLGNVWADKVLLLIIFVITSVKIVIMIIWSVIDSYHLINEESLQTHVKTPYYQVIQSCFSDHTGIWLLLILGFTGLLFLILVILAIKTRKIKRKDFKDTKKMNALIMAIFLDICIGVTLWGVLRLSGESIGSKVVLSVGYLLVAMLIILFLFIPKLSAPIRRRICKHVTSKSSSIDHQTTLSTQIQEKELSTVHVT